jgi:hypothetical protein
MTPMPIPAMGDQRRARAEARRGMRGLAAGMAAADHDDVERPLFHVKHSSFPEAETGEDLVQHRLYIDPADRESSARSACAVLPRQVPHCRGCDTSPAPIPKRETTARSIDGLAVALA